jgi:hypothetical protein
MFQLQPFPFRENAVSAHVVPMFFGSEKDYIRGNYVDPALY